jgi:hypothetical protein
MTDEVETHDDAERIRESFGKLADDGFRLLRVNLVLLGIYISGIGLLLQGTTDVVRVRLITSWWTLGGVVLLMLAIGLSAALYESARTVSVAPLYEESESEIYSNIAYRRVIWNLRSTIIFMLTSGIALGVGVWDALIPIGIDAITVWGVVCLLILLMALPRGLMEVVTWVRS